MVSDEVLAIDSDENAEDADAISLGVDSYRYADIRNFFFGRLKRPGGKCQISYNNCAETPPPQVDS